jgi:hypothetical protein
MDCKFDALKHAATIADVIHATSSYLASWTRDELERLPDSCRPAWVRDTTDIEFWADRLLAESARAQLFIDDERKLDGMTNHFLVASVRLRQLAV